MDITKLDFNWGGSGYPMYDGRMEDGEGSNQPLDSQGRVEAALAAFGGNDGGGSDDAEAGQRQDRQPNAEEGQRQSSGEEPDAGQQQQQAEGQFTDEQRQADPVFKELNEFKTAIDAVFDKHGLAAAAESNGRTAHEEADLQLADANILYQIMRGERTPSNLLDTMINVGNWQQGQRDAVANDLIAWLTKAGYLKDGAAAAAGVKKAAGKEGRQQFADPLEERLNKVETAQQERDRKDQERAGNVEANRIFGLAKTEVDRLCQENGIDKKDWIFYLEQVSALIGGKRDIIGRIGKNNFVDVKKAFDTIFGKELERVKRLSDARLKAQQKKDKNQKITAGGSPAAPSGAAKRNVANRDDRIAAATEMLQGS